MHLLISVSKRVFRIFSLTLIAFLLGACGAATPVPTLTATNAPSLSPITPTITPSPIPTITSLPTGTYTATPEPDTPTSCKTLNKDGKLYVLSDNVYYALGPSGEELDQVLADNYPEWANYEQNVWWSPKPVTVGKIVRDASFQEKFALNSEVTLVTLGESLNWQLPSDGDLFLQSLTIGERLNYLWLEWTHPENKHIRAQFSEVANAATYALYVYFDYDRAKLQAWCMAYQQLFGTSSSHR